MKVAVLCTEEQKAELLLKPVSGNAVFAFFVQDAIAFAEVEADVFFDLMNETNSPYKKDKPLFMNAVATTLKSMPSNSIRINAWNGFLKRETIELVANDNMRQEASSIMQALGWKFLFAPDEPGMVAPRVVSMIVNEAYFGLEDGISTKEEIDTAMKLGTNYPFGPFEWGQKIGLKNILSLLQKLAEQDKRYTPSKLLIEEAHGTVA